MIRFLSYVVSFVLASSLLVTSNAHAVMEKSHKMDLPNSISDSLPWFAIREFSDNMAPFTRSHLAKIAKNSDRTALVYFATWCIPCRAGIKRLVANYDEIQKKKLSIVLVNIGERNEDLIKRWIANLGVSQFTIVYDPFKRLTEGFGLVNEGEEISLPRTIVLNKNMKPLFMLGEEGQDWPQVLWSK